MTWEETIANFQNNPDYKKILFDSYLESDIIFNAERFKDSREFKETIKIVNEYLKGVLKIADIGAGNGIASYAFSILGHKVYAIEPYKSDLVGFGAINILKKTKKLNSIEILPQCMEKNSLENKSVDLVYCRQVLHHAEDLKVFTKAAHRILANNGIMIASREHVINNNMDKSLFLSMHPFHKYTQNENAFTLSEYIDAFTCAGFRIERVFKFFESHINYYPLTDFDIETINNKLSDNILKRYQKKFGSNVLSVSLGKLNLFWLFLKNYYPVKEKSFPGRMYTFILRKV